MEYDGFAFGGVNFCGAHFRWNILNKASAAKYIKRLHTAANPKDGNIFFYCKLNKQLFAFIKKRAYAVAFSCILFSVIFRRNIDSAGKQQSVYMVKRIGTVSFFRKKRKNIRNSAAAGNGIDIILVYCKSVFFVFIGRKNSDNGFRIKALLCFILCSKYFSRFFILLSYILSSSSSINC